jgi:hypothetical protein
MIATHHPKPDRLFPTSNSDRPSSPRSPFPHTKPRSHPHHPKPDRLNLKIKQRSPHTTHKTRSPISHTKQRSPLTPHKPDRLNLNIKQRSPLYHPQKPIAYPLNQNSDRPHNPTPDRTFPTSNNDRPNNPQTRSQIPQIKQRSPLNTQHPIAYFPHQTAIAPHSP